MIRTRWQAKDGNGRAPIRFRACLSSGLFLVFLLFLGSPVRAADPSEPAKDGAVNTWFATTFVSASSLGVRVIHYWSKGRWMRAETVMNGHPVVTIIRDTEYISYDLATGKGARIRRAPAATSADTGRIRPFGNDLEELIAQGAEKIEDTIMAGQRGEVWRITDSAGRRKLSVTHDEPKLPLRLETFVRGTSETVTLDYMNWARGLALPDAFFEPPPNVRLESFDYEAYLEASTTRAIGPVLYPDLLHGTVKR